MRVGPLFPVLLSVALAACSPVLDWRRVQPEGSTLEAMFPCKPASHVRRVPLGGIEAEMTMFACATGGHTYAVTFADVVDPARVGDALLQLRTAAQANMRGELGASTAAVVPGMTPNVQAARLSLRGTLPDGRPGRQEAAFFVHGTRVYQASIVGTDPPAEAIEVFFSGLRLSS